MLAGIWGLTWQEALGVLGAATSGAGAVVSAWFAVKRAKRETRATVEHECLERIAKLKANRE